MASEPTAERSTKLQCLANGEPPAELGSDLRSFGELSLPVRSRLWEVLGPSLVEHLTPEIEQRVTRFCAELGISASVIAPFVRGCRFLLRNAASADLSPDELKSDLSTLMGVPSPELVEFLLRGYEGAKRELRLEMLRASLTDHGHLLSGVDWRVDLVASSNRGWKGRVPLAMLTLKYLDGGKEERITLQATPDALASLRAAIDQVLR